MKGVSPFFSYVCHVSIYRTSECSIHGMEEKHYDAPHLIPFCKVKCAHKNIPHPYLQVIQSYLNLNDKAKPESTPRCKTGRFQNRRSEKIEVLFNPYISQYLQGCFSSSFTSKLNLLSHKDE